jgi:glycosyltransferase involved in cell wall biosynthesis
MTMKRSNIAVLIPAWNEETTVASVVANLKKDIDCDVIVINDASMDGTVAQAERAGAKVLSLPVNLGAWGATQTGIRYALKQGYRQVITMDADGQHDSAFIPDLLAPIQEGTADIVIGSCTDRGSKARKIAWMLFRWITGLDIEDLTSGFRSYDSSAMILLASREATLLEYQDVGVLMLLMQSGLRIREIEVKMQPRQVGSSKVFSSWFKVAEYMTLTMILCSSHIMNRKRRLSATQRGSL